MARFRPVLACMLIKHLCAGTAHRERSDGSGGEEYACVAPIYLAGYQLLSQQPRLFACTASVKTTEASMVIAPCEHARRMHACMLQHQGKDALH